MSNLHLKSASTALEMAGYALTMHADACKLLADTFRKGVITCGSKRNSSLRSASLKRHRDEMNKLSKQLERVPAAVEKHRKRARAQRREIKQCAQNIVNALV